MKMIFEYGPALGMESFDIRVPSPDKVQTFLAQLCYSHLWVSDTYQSHMNLAA